MKTLPENYKKNVSILKENLKRGMSQEQANSAINSMEVQFINADKYNENEKDFLNEMRKVMIEHFTHLSINIIK